MATPESMKNTSIHEATFHSNSVDVERKKREFLARIHQMNEEHQPISLPTNVAVRIFSFVSRDDLERCKLVCKQWKWLVEYGNKSLQKREINILWLSTCREFTVVARYGSRVQKFGFKKYFRDLDIQEAEVHEDTKRGVKEFQRVFPCGRRIATSTTVGERFHNFGPFHQRACKQFQRPLIYSRHRQVASNYTRKLFTPPLVFYERIARLLRDCTVKTLVFSKFTFTDFFVEKFAEIVAGPGAFNVQQLSLHCCRLRSIHTDVFHRFLGDVVHAERYFLENLRFALPNHISAELLKKDGIRRATIFYVGHSLSRYNTDIRFNLNDEEFLNYARSLIPDKMTALLNKTKFAEDEKDPKRQFFGISNCGVTNDALKDYKRLYLSADAETQELLYDHLLFGERRFLSPELEARVSTAPVHAQAAAAGMANFQIAGGGGVLPAAHIGGGGPFGGGGGGPMIIGGGGLMGMMGGADEDFSDGVDDDVDDEEDEFM